MDSTTLAIIALQFLKKKKEKRKIQNRRWWVHPVLARRMDQGQFIVTYNELRTNEGISIKIIIVLNIINYYYYFLIKTLLLYR